MLSVTAQKPLLSQLILGLIPQIGQWKFKICFLMKSRMLALLLEDKLLHHAVTVFLSLTLSL